MNIPMGYIALVLHAHLPFVRHPENATHLEENWLFEAMTDTYLPLLEVMEGWVADAVPFALTMSMTPTLTSMLADPLLQQRYIDHLDRSIALSEQQVKSNSHRPEVAQLAVGYRQRFVRAKERFLNRYQRDLVGAFGRMQHHGLEIIASAATHGFLPLMEPVSSVAQAQIRTGVDHHQDTFGIPARGFWLPECGYHPDHDRYLVDAGIEFTFCDTHGVTHAVPRPRYSVYAPVFSPGGLAVFARDVESSKQVWSADEGYPGDVDYREFYRDVGYDAPWQEIAPFMPWGVRTDTGLKYYRITGAGTHKELYDPDRARAKAHMHAANFVFNREHQVRYLAAHMDRPPIITAPYDAELFGHWWFEGPIFLDHVMRRIARSDVLRAITPTQYLRLHPTNQVVRLSHSTWGYQGYSKMWLSQENDWIYPHLHHASRRMEALARSVGFNHSTSPVVVRALNQALRELFLAQSSDWAFIMKSGTVVEYAVRRTHQHLHNFLRLSEQIHTGVVDETELDALERQNNIFPSLDYRKVLGGAVALASDSSRR